MTNPTHPTDTHTPKPGKVHLPPLRFEDALRGLLTTKPQQKQDTADQTDRAPT